MRVRPERIPSEHSGGFSTPRRQTRQTVTPFSRVQAANALAASPFGINIIAGASPPQNFPLPTCPLAASPFGHNQPNLPAHRSRPGAWGASGGSGRMRPGSPLNPQRAFRRLFHAPAPNATGRNAFLPSSSGECPRRVSIRHKDYCRAAAPTPSPYPLPPIPNHFIK